MTIDFTKTSLTEIYGCNCFNDAVMRERLPKSVYREVKLVREGKCELDADVAEVVAYAMKEWAIEKGATHFTHWFTPLTGLTAEKHDAFISPTPDGKVILEFSGKELIKGEPDASSFPNGGLRATFEARGYTAWDVNSAAFVREETFYIPTAFISYNGEVLDKKVPLLRSMEAVNRQALRILKVFNTPGERVETTIGAEQEYFLIEKDLADARPDILLTGRTVFGAPPAKGQEMEDHYFGTIKERASAFMKEFNYELWKLGIAAKTQHKEVAPNQFEIAPIFDTASASFDKNQLLMDVLKKVAARHSLVALLHEKPFAGVNGSGKHNNWSLCTETGLNLLDPGHNPHDNAQFLVFLSAVIRAVDIYAPLLRTSAANSGNDHRLGANEAPPAIISIFLGEQLTRILEDISEDRLGKNSAGETLEIGITRLPKLPKDLSDRNRTSPFAFTGNKFEFRMVPSSASVATPTTVLNTAVADILSEFAETLEKAEDLNRAVKDLVKKTFREHKRIIFNGNGYSDAWVAEAEKRGLPNIRSTVEALPEYTKEPSVSLFTRHGILSKGELESRAHVYLEKYNQQINIEAKVMIEMAERDIMPAGIRFVSEMAESVTRLKTAAADIPVDYLVFTLAEVNGALKEFREKTDRLADVLAGIRALPSDNILAQAREYSERVVPAMKKLRESGDKLEVLMPRTLWPFPSYMDLLFRL